MSRLFMRVRVMKAMDIAELDNNEDSADNDNHDNKDDNDKKAENDKNADNDTTSIRDDLCEGGAGGRLPLRSTSSSLMRNISIILVIEVSIFSLFLLLINNITVS